MSYETTFASSPRNAALELQKSLEELRRRQTTKAKSDIRPIVPYRDFAEKHLKIRTKSGQIEPLIFNRAQQHIDDRLEAQRAETGKVRALILKGRQQGCSTYVAGRFYYKTSHTKGLRSFILTHEDQATQNLFEMVDRYHHHCSDEVRPSTGAANAKELYFDELDSGYRVGTAGTKGVGRSATIQLFHGSEVAFWPFAETHAAGILQAIPNTEGTESILESTANGLGNVFHQMWCDAEQQRGDYIAIFVPWFWQEEYRKPAPPGFSMVAEELEYSQMYGLDAEQIVWRRDKILELRDPILFKQEYPATAAEAFQMSGHDAFITPELVLRARKASLEGIGRLVLGIDPARFGDDRFAIAWRKGRRIEKVESKLKLDVVTGANWVKEVIDRDKPAKVFIDVGGSGAGVYDLLRDWGYSDRDSGDKNIVRSIDFGGSPQQTELLYSQADGKPMAPPRNRRAEMWLRSKQWLEEVGGADVPDSDALQTDACAPTYTYDMQQRLVIESKEHMRARSVRSPDLWDAVALTFAEPVPAEVTPRKRQRGRGGWMGA
jgi:hypothetical protein